MRRRMQMEPWRSEEVFVFGCYGRRLVVVHAGKFVEGI